MSRAIFGRKRGAILHGTTQVKLNIHVDRLREKKHKKFDNWFTFELTEVIFFFRRVSAKTSYRSELPDLLLLLLLLLLFIKQ
jgi:hypothetical protein